MNPTWSLWVGFLSGPGRMSPGSPEPNPNHTLNIWKQVSKFFVINLSNGWSHTTTHLARKSSKRFWSNTPYCKNSASRWSNDMGDEMYQYVFNLLLKRFLDCLQGYFPTATGSRTFLPHAISVSLSVIGALLVSAWAWALRTSKRWYMRSDALLRFVTRPKDEY